MNRVFRLTIAVLLVGGFALAAAGVWAAPTFRGTVPAPPDTGTGTGSTEPIDMGTAIITPTCTDCTVTVEAVNPADLAPAPEGKAFLGDAFKVDIVGPLGSTVKISFAFPPEFAAKNAKIYSLNTLVNPPVWVEVPGAVIENGVISISGGTGTYTLIGDA